MIDKLVSIDSCDTPLRLTELPKPEVRDNELRIAVSVCGICHTELDEIEGRTPPPELPVVPGHEVVGYVESVGPRVTRFSPGDRVGVGWIHESDGSVNENLSTDFRATGRDHNGGYAEYMTVDEHYAYRIPDVFSDAEAAPLLCAGAVGFRALKLCNLANGRALGLMGFGGSAHIVLQLSRYLYPESPVYVFARDSESRGFARELGATWAGDITDDPPKPPHAVIDTTPAWKPVLASLKHLAPGGRLVINAIRKEDSDNAELLGLSYHEHLWMEKEIKSVANVTSGDLAEFLELAAEIPIRPEVTVYPLAEANRALVALKRENVKGAKVLKIR